MIFITAEPKIGLNITKVQPKHQIMNELVKPYIYVKLLGDAGGRYFLNPNFPR